MLIRMALIAGIGLAAGLGGCASAPPAAPAAPDDPVFAEALGRLDSNVPDGCRTYVKAKCQTFHDAHRVQICEAYVQAINGLVKQAGEGAADTWCRSAK